MALDQIPPWLNVGPQAFGNAAAEGAHLDLARQQLETETAMNAARLSVQKQQQDRQFALQQEQTGFEQEMKQTQLQMATQQVARKYAAQQQYQSLVNSGVEPAQAMLKVGPSLGINMVGAGQLARWGAPPPPPQHVDFGNGNGGTRYANKFYPDKPAKPEFTDEIIDGNHYQRDSTGRLYAVSHGGGMNTPGAITPQQKLRAGFLQKRISELSSDPLADRDPSKRAQLQSYQQEFDSMSGAPMASGSTGVPPTSAVGSNGLPKIVSITPRGGQPSATPQSAPIALGSSLGGDDETPATEQGSPAMSGLAAVFGGDGLPAPSGGGKFVLDKNNKVQWISSGGSDNVEAGDLTDSAAGPSQQDLAYVQKIIGSKYFNH